MSANLLREAAASIRERAVWTAIADWLDAEAATWDRIYTDTQRPSRGIDEPAAIHYGDPVAAGHAADLHTARALAVARAYLGRDT